MKLKVHIYPAEEGGYWAEIPSLPGCVSEGESIAQVLANMKEAAEGWLLVAAESNASATPLQVSEIEL